MTNGVGPIRRRVVNPPAVTRRRPSGRIGVHLRHGVRHRRKLLNSCGMSSDTGEHTPLATSPGGAENVTKIRTLIVDDEPMARERVLSLLQQQPDIEVVGECADGAQALSAIERLEPELVFLDVQIPVMDGFGVIRALAPNRMPLVVFTTAYDEYALKAFEVHALDY